MNVSPNNRTPQPQPQAPSGRPAPANRPAVSQGVRHAPRGAAPSAPSAPSGPKASMTPDSAAAPTRSSVASSLQRLDAYAESLSERLQGAAQDASPQESAALRDVADFLQHGLERIRAGIADGTMAPEDIQRGTKVMFERSRQMLDKARPAAPEAPDAAQGTSDADVKAATPDDAAAAAKPGDDASKTDAMRSTSDDADAMAFAKKTSDASTDADVRGDDASRTDADAAAAAEEATRELGRSILAGIENLPAELLSLIDPNALEEGSDRSGRLYGPLDGAEAITPRDGRVDLAG